MKRAGFLVAGAALFAAHLCLAASPQPSSQSPREFLAHLYTPYETGDNPNTNHMGAEADEILALPLLALLREEQNIAPGDGDALGMDPICDCQDYTPFKPTSITILTRTPLRAYAAVTFNNDGPVTIGYDLIKSAQGWRIADIHDPDIPSLRAWLKAHAR